jgi:transcriptional regulator with XRE-family HTH domain
MFPNPTPHTQLLALQNKSTAVLPCAYLVGTGGDTGVAYLAKRQDRGYRFIHLESAVTLSPVGPLDVRSTIETLSHIREVFRLSISDLAAACHVSRQAVYKWISGESSSLEPENQNRLDDLYGAAELFAANGIAGSATLLKRRNKMGKTLVETMQAGESAQDWARAMLETLALESQQRAMLESRLRARKRPTPFVSEWGTPVIGESEA